MRAAVVRSVSIVAIATALWQPAGAQPGEGLLVRPDSVTRVQGRLSLHTSGPAWLQDQRSDEEPVSLRGLSVMGDYYLTGALLGERQTGGLRATGALLIGPRGQTLGAASLGLPANASGNGLVVDRRLTAIAPDTDSAALPYLGIGYTGLSSRGGFAFSADLGVVALTPGTSVRFGRAFTAGPNLDEVVRDLRLSPMLQLGVSYSF